MASWGIEKQCEGLFQELMVACHKPVQSAGPRVLAPVGEGVLIVSGLTGPALRRPWSSVWVCFWLYVSLHILIHA